MSVGARPLKEREVQVIFERKLADFAHKARWLVLHHLDLATFLEAAGDDPDVRMAVETGFIRDLDAELRDPVLVRDREVFTCPPLALKVLATEPPEIHSAFVEGAFLRKLFRFFVPAAYEGGEPWEVVQQVREIMQRHWAFQLVACESVIESSEGVASLHPEKQSS
jgi:hypothetical protein